MYVERYDISRDTTLVIGEFTILWCRFEQIYFGRNISGEKIVEVSNQIAKMSDVFPLYQEVRLASTQYLGDMDEETIKQRIYSEENPGNQGAREHIQRFLSGTSGDADWIGCVLYIQRIRNNLFHGLKDIYRLDAQREMFTTICALLVRLLQNRGS